MMATGVASPRAQGQEITSTDTPATSARLGVPVTMSQTMAVTRAMAMTMGTKTPATRSASLAMGAFEAEASSTSWMIRARAVSSPTPVARMVKEPVWLMVAALTLSPGVLLHRDGLAGQGGLIHRGHPLGDHPVHRHRAAGLDPEQVAGLHLLHRELHLRPVPEHEGGLGGQIHQRPDGVAGLALGAGLQVFAHGDQGQDHAHRLQIEVVHAVLVGQGRVPMAQGPAGHEDGPEGVEEGGGAAQGDQRVHIGGPVPQGAEAVDKVVVVDIHDGQHQHQLGQGEYHAVLVPQEDGGQGSPHHVAHAQVEQGHQEHDGPDQPVLHAPGLLRRRVGLGRRCRGRGAFTVDAGVIARPVHRGADVLGGELGLVKLRHHAVGQQVDRGGVHPLQGVHRLLHVGLAGGAAHAGHVKFALHSIPPISGEIPHPRGVSIL